MPMFYPDREFIPAEMFVAKFVGEKAALHYLNTVFLPRAKEDAAYGRVHTEVFRFPRHPDQADNTGTQIAQVAHAETLHKLLAAAGWLLCWSFDNDPDVVLYARAIKSSNETHVSWIKSEIGPDGETKLTRV